MYDIWFASNGYGFSQTIMPDFLVSELLDFLLSIILTNSYKSLPVTSVRKKTKITLTKIAISLDLLLSNVIVILRNLQMKETCGPIHLFRLQRNK